jgi:hypothetical protein
MEVDILAQIKQSHFLNSSATLQQLPQFSRIDCTKPNSSIGIAAFSPAQEIMK